MRRFTDALDGVRIASPCSADWDAMYGDERRRFCSECGLNVYNLSAMSKQEAESLLLTAEGRVCVRLYRRRDGSVMTSDCPVGSAALKRKTIRVASAVVSGVFTLLTGLGMARLLEGSSIDLRPTPPRKERKEQPPKISFGGAVSNLNEIKEAILKDQKA